jgi:hypothetical protein
MKRQQVVQSDMSTSHDVMVDEVDYDKEKFTK